MEQGVGRATVPAYGEMEPKRVMRYQKMFNHNPLIRSVGFGFSDNVLRLLVITGAFCALVRLILLEVKFVGTPRLNTARCICCYTLYPIATLL